tara:strand:+ start:9724 stop:10008 length:285 start_codon:yes stop_codon:yes gene_type:complete
MRRDEFVMSGKFVPMPEQNNFIPPPEPVDSTFGVGFSLLRPYRSATTVENGYTVDEPTIAIVSLAETRLAAASKKRFTTIILVILQCDINNSPE